MSERISFFDAMLATARSVGRRIDLAVQAPSSVVGETWRFVVLT
jgi:hypothetical protein